MQLPLKLEIRGNLEETQILKIWFGAENLLVYGNPARISPQQHGPPRE